MEDILSNKEILRKTVEHFLFLFLKLKKLYPSKKHAFKEKYVGGSSFENKTNTILKIQ